MDEVSFEPTREFASVVCSLEMCGLRTGPLADRVDLPN